MNRDIKFRGYTGTKWIYGYYVKGITRHTITDSLGSVPVEVISKTIGQYTGTKDKNGVEIYEGDIVKFDNEPTVYTVEFGKIGYDSRWNGLTGFYFKNYYVNYGGADFMELDYSIEPESMEVIGNIYENKDLLEVSNDR